jgi:hypothetical protein
MIPFSPKGSHDLCNIDHKARCLDEIRVLGAGKSFLITNKKSHWPLQNPPPIPLRKR